MAFCEQCGASLELGARFCESCGASVEDDIPVEKDRTSFAESDEAMTMFCGADWSSKWLRATSSHTDADIGIILTREAALVGQIEATSDEVRGIVSSYISDMGKHGTRYYYLNLDACPFYEGNGDVNSVVSALRTVVDVARPKYLFIIGNEDIIDVARWENQARDSDSEVESDLCYATLDVNTPWGGQAYNFNEIMRVGRFPTCAGESAESFSYYFSNTPQCNGKTGELTPYGLSALVWEDESNDEYGEISRKAVDVSPEVTKETVEHRIPKNANLMFFNLHGSNDTRYWYGQQGGTYPEAFSPEILAGWDDPYFVGVEACYGARYVGNLSPDESIVLTALRNNCMAFLGSSKIAFGTSEPQGSCADIVIGHYIKNLPKGFSAGDAYVEGLRALSRDRSSMDDSDIKTLAEFALYGDPSVCMTTQKPSGMIKSLFKGLGTPKGLSVPVPDVRKAVRMAIAEVDARIESIVDEYFESHVLPQFGQTMANVQQTIYKMANTGLNQKRLYSKVSGKLTLKRIGDPS